MWVLVCSSKYWTIASSPQNWPRLRFFILILRLLILRFHNHSNISSFFIFSYISLLLLLFSIRHWILWINGNKNCRNKCWLDFGTHTHTQDTTQTAASAAAPTSLFFNHFGHTHTHTRKLCICVCVWRDKSHWVICLFHFEYNFRWLNLIWCQNNFYMEWKGVCVGRNLADLPSWLNTKMLLHYKTPYHVWYEHWSEQKLRPWWKDGERERKTK